MVSLRDLAAVLRHSGAGLGAFPWRVCICEDCQLIFPSASIVGRVLCVVATPSSSLAASGTEPLWAGRATVVSATRAQACAAGDFGGDSVLFLASGLDHLHLQSHDLPALVLLGFGSLPCTDLRPQVTLVGGCSELFLGSYRGAWSWWTSLA